MWPIKIFLGSNHITGMDKPKLVKFCTQVGYINFSNRTTYHPQKGHGYSHVTVAVCCDAASLAGLLATAELLVLVRITMLCFLDCNTKSQLLKTLFNFLWL